MQHVSKKLIRLTIMDVPTPQPQDHAIHKSEYPTDNNEDMLMAAGDLIYFPGLLRVM